MTRTLLTLSLLSLAACATTYSRGRKLAEQGQFEQASRYWMDALDEDDLAKGPRRGLDEYGPSAVWVYVEVAEEHEAERRHLAAIEAYGSALLLADDLARYNVDPGVDRRDLGLRIVDLEDQLTRYRYDQGVAAAERRDFAAAIDWWEQSRELHPDYEDTTQRIGDAHRDWGHDALEARTYPVAIAQFASAITWTNDTEARGWHDVTAIALGRYYLGQGACRHAFELFDAVRATANDADLMTDLARAEDCARVEVVVLPFERVADGALANVDVASVVTDAVTERIRNDGSPYLRLVDPELKDDVPNTFGHRYGVRGRLTQVLYERPEPVSEPLVTPGTRVIPCPVVEGYSDYSDDLCPETLDLTADVSIRSVTIGLVGSVRVSDPRTGELMTTRSLDARAGGEVRSRTSFRLDGERVAVGIEATQSIFAIDPDVLAIPTTEAELIDDTEALRRTSHALAEAAAEAILSVIDVEPTPAPPRSLDVRAPVTDASQIEFGEDRVDDGTPTRAVIRNRE